MITPPAAGQLAAYLVSLAKELQVNAVHGGKRLADGAVN
jgi:hypothetical protein